MKRIGLWCLCGVTLLSVVACGSNTTYNAGMTALQNQNYAKAYQLFLESDDPRAAEVLEGFVFVPVEERFVSTSNEQGNVTTYTYDDKGYLIKYETTEKGLVSPCEYLYDIDGNLLRVTEPDGVVEQYSYDANGNRVAKIRYQFDKELYREEYRYDDQNRLIEQVITDKTGVSRYTWEFDKAGHCTKAWKGNDTGWDEVTTEYDERGNVVKATTRHSGGSWSESTAQYNDQGKKTHSWYKDKSGAYNEIIYEYDANGQCIKERYPHNQVAEYTYDAQGNLLSETTILGNRTAYTYDEKGNLLTKTNTSAGEGGIETRVVYTYDEAGRLLSQTTVMGDETTVNSYTYDPYGNRLTFRQNFGNAVLEHTYRWAVYYYPDGLPEPVEELLSKWDNSNP